MQKASISPQVPTKSSASGKPQHSMAFLKSLSSLTKPKQKIPSSPGSSSKHDTSSSQDDTKKSFISKQ